MKVSIHIFDIYILLQFKTVLLYKKVLLIVFLLQEIITLNFLAILVW